MKRVLFLEINELPPIMLQMYLNQTGFENLKKLYTSSIYAQTITTDTGHLSPWVTWPTVHRGITNEYHQIKDINQDEATFKGKPIWDEVTEKGLSVGIFGCLNSGKISNVGPNGFYVPDTFTNHEPIPSHLQKIVNFNLRLVSDNSRKSVNQTSLTTKEKIEFVIACAKNGLRIKNILLIIYQLILERVDQRYISRRPIFQTIVFFDIFLKLYKTNRPDFSAFFSNHIAGIQHRFWTDIVKDYKLLDTFEKKNFMDFSMRVLDEMCRDALKLAKKDPTLSVIMASSMGQKEAPNLEHPGFEVQFSDVKKFFDFFEISSNEIEVKLAMHPQITIFIKNEEVRSKFSRISGLKNYLGETFINLHSNGATISLTLDFRSFKTKNSSVLFDQTKIKLGDLGLKFIDIDAGSGYHDQIGFLTAYNAGGISLSELLDTAEIKSKVMTLLGISP